MLVASVLSLKGGVGKTSTVLGLAGAAMERGLATLVVDLDPQANATTVLEPSEVRFTTGDVLADGRPGVLREAIRPSAWDSLVDVVAAEPTLEHRDHPALTPAGRDGELLLRRAMQGVTGYDLVLLDCPPSLGELTKNALAASDRALIVTEPTLFALQGAQQALDAVEVVRRAFNLRLTVAGIVVNKVQVRSEEHRYRIDELLAGYGPLVLDPVVPERSAVLHAQGAYLPVQRWPSAGAREVSAAYAALLDALLRTVSDGSPFVRRRASA